MKHVLPLAALTLLAFCLWFRGYENPPRTFWDENYHIASAQKYLHGVFFMEPHPPLGKLLIALGEYLLDADPNDDRFLNTDYGKDPEGGYSFVGYRFFPALLGAACVPLSYGIFFALTSSTVLALLFSMLLLFDNALIVHLRGAMLEGPQLFFFLGAVFSGILLLKSPRLLSALAFGAFFGAAIAVKINAIVLALFLPAFFLQTPKANRLRYLLTSIISLLLIYFGSWLVHFSIATKINAKLSENGYYLASPDSRLALDKGESALLQNFPVMFSDALRYFSHYQKGVPTLNLCKSDENGSPSFFWPFGGKTINYRWENFEGKTSYLYLVPNITVWIISLAAILLCYSLVVSNTFFGLKVLPKNYYLILLFLSIHLIYTISVASVSRALYLYHYFIPLILGLLLAASLFRELPAKKGQIIGALAVLLAALNCWYFSALTYYTPILPSDLRARAWFSLWDLRPAGAESSSLIAKPLCDPKLKTSARLVFANLKATKIVQEWGEPQQDTAVEGAAMEVGGKTYTHGFGVHAYSLIQFQLKSRYSNFRVLAGVPDYIAKRGTAQGSVIFQIWADGNLLTESKLMSAGEPAQEMKAAVNGVGTLELVVLNGGDGNVNDHALWLEPQIE